MENRLYIYPTSRAIREQKEQSIAQNRLLPKMVTVSDFERRAITQGDCALVDSMQRKLFLKEVSTNALLQRFLGDFSLIKFYTQADDFFSFFQEVNAEGVSIKDLALADSYAEFEDDLALLEQLLQEYKSHLASLGLTDSIFTPLEYKLNESYIKSFDSFYLILEGYLTKFELELFIEIAKIRPFIIKLRTTPFNQKVINLFASIGIPLAQDCEIEFDLSSKKILSQKPLPLKFKSEVVECSEQLEQIAIAQAKIEQMVQSGIEPKKIVLIVPDESIVPLIRTFDRAKNFNFAMGQSMREHTAYKFLEQIYKFLSGDAIAKEFLMHNEFDFKKLPGSQKLSVEEFFEQLAVCHTPLFNSEQLLEELEKINLLDRFYRFKHIFAKRQMHFKEWLFIWLHDSVF